MPNGGIDPLNAILELQIRKLAQERDELQQILDLQESRVRVVTKEWQKAHGKPNVLPDLGMLIDWMWGQTKVCEFIVDSRKKPEVVLADHHCPLCGGPVKWGFVKNSAPK